MNPMGALNSPRRRNGHLQQRQHQWQHPQHQRRAAFHLAGNQPKIPPVTWRSFKRFRFGFSDDLSRRERYTMDNLGGGNSNMFYFHPENWGRCPIWLIFFKWVETGRNHQPDNFHGERTPQVMERWMGFSMIENRISIWVFFGRSRLMFNSPPGSHESISHPTLLSRWCSELPIWWDRFSNRSL